MQKSPICTSTDRGNRSIDEEGLKVESNTADESMSLWRSQSGSVNTSWRSSDQRVKRSRRREGV